MAIMMAETCSCC